MNLLFVMHVRHARHLFFVWNQASVHAIAESQLSSQSSTHSHAHAVVSENLRVDGVPVASTAKDYQSGFYDDLG